MNDGEANNKDGCGKRDIILKEVRFKNCSSRFLLHNKFATVKYYVVHMTNAERVESS